MVHKSFILNTRTATISEGEIIFQHIIHIWLGRLFVMYSISLQNLNNKNNTNDMVVFYNIIKWNAVLFRMSPLSRQSYFPISRNHIKWKIHDCVTLITRYFTISRNHIKWKIHDCVTNNSSPFNSEVKARSSGRQTKFFFTILTSWL